jgi:CheY-like chemotaxis protein
MNTERKNILLIEDDVVDVLAVERVLRQMDRVAEYGLFKAGNGRDALNMLQGAAGLPPIPLPVLIILDLNMPRMNGFEFLEVLDAMKELRHLPVLVVTTSPYDRRRILRGPGNVVGYLEKPLTAPQLQATITAVYGARP